MYTLTTIYETTQLCFDFVESSKMYEEVDATEQPEQRYDNVSALYCVYYKLLVSRCTILIF